MTYKHNKDWKLKNNQKIRTTLITPQRKNTRQITFSTKKNINILRAMIMR